LKTRIPASSSTSQRYLEEQAQENLEGGGGGGRWETVRGAKKPSRYSDAVKK